MVTALTKDTTTVQQKNAELELPAVPLLAIYATYLKVLMLRTQTCQEDVHLVLGILHLAQLVRCKDRHIRLKDSIAISGKVDVHFMGATVIRDSALSYVLLLAF